VRDADYALETTHLARNEILRQSTAAVFGMSQTSTNIAMNLLQF
jgi:flagellin-like hook-associated protein FlgL